MAQNIVMLLIENTAIFIVLLGAVWLLKTIFKKQLTARLQYLIWGIVVLKLLVPFSFTTQWSPYVLTQSASPNVPVVVEQADTTDNAAAAPKPEFTVDQALPISQTLQTPQAAKASETEKAVLTENQTQLAQPIKIDWMVLIVYVWLTGAAVCAYRFWRRAHRLKKNVLRCRAGEAPEWMQDVFKQCREEIKIRRTVELVVQSALPVPAVMGVFRPVLMVPEELTKEKDTRKLRHVFMHELMHCKRRDLAVIWGLNGLCALYWFNPLVWLCCRLIHRDMEAACDSMVLDKLGNAHRPSYIETILQFSGQKEFAHVQAAMSLNDGCMKMRQRILSMYIKRTGKHVKAVVLVLALMMLFSAFTAGCQPTPEKPIVQTKNNESVAQAIAQSSDEPSEINTFTAPATWQDEASDEAKKIDILIDANVVVPVDTWGIYELVRVPTGKEEARKMLEAIVGDVPIIGEQTLQSKDELINQIAGYKEQKAEFEEMYANYDDSEEGAASSSAPAPSAEPEPFYGKLTKEDLKTNIEMFTQMIAEDEQKLLTAPDEATLVKNEVDLDVFFDQDVSYEQAVANGITLSKQGEVRAASVSGKADLGRETPADISIYYGTGIYGDCFNINYINYGGDEQCFTEGVAVDSELFKCDISVEEAAAIARDKIQELGFDYLDISSTKVCEMLDRKRMEGDKEPQCFEFTFTRKLDGAMATYAWGDGVITQEEAQERHNADYTPSWTTNEATVRVDDSGIISLNINVMKSDVNRQAYGIQLKDFADIMDIFKQQVFIENAYTGPGNLEQVVGREIHVSEIKLGYMPVPWKDHPGQTIFTPVWDFFGKEVITFEEGIEGDLGEALDENNQLEYDLGIHSLLTINALDGTIIDRDY